MTDDLKVPLIPDCSSCIINSLRTGIPLLTDDEEKQFEFFRIAYKRIAEGYEKNLTPLSLSIQLYQELYSLAGVENPYSKLKKMSTEAALRALPEVMKRIEGLSGEEKLRASLAASIAGNVIDYNTSGHRPNLDRLVEAFESVLEKGFLVDHSEHLWHTLENRRGQLLFLADNAGEVIFDIPLLRAIRQMGWKIVFVVKGRAMTNDATREDIEGTEIEDLAKVVDSGAWAHGVPFQWVSKSFMKNVQESDLVISKGQANIESFPEIQRQTGIETYYVTRAKCPHISKVLGVKPGANVVLRRPDPD
jgi:uncharacterized protein with ATP-grasp and redox domains